MLHHNSHKKFSLPAITMAYQDFADVAKISLATRNMEPLRRS